MGAFKDVLRSNGFVLSTGCQPWLINFSVQQHGERFQGRVIRVAEKHHTSNTGDVVLQFKFLTQAQMKHITLFAKMLSSCMSTPDFPVSWTIKCTQTVTYAHARITREHVPQLVPIIRREFPEFKINEIKGRGPFMVLTSGLGKIQVYPTRTMVTTNNDISDPVRRIHALIDSVVTCPSGGGVVMAAPISLERDTSSSDTDDESTLLVRPVPMKRVLAPNSASMSIAQRPRPNSAFAPFGCERSRPE
jgi:hypothetical protein